MLDPASAAGAGHANGGLARTDDTAMMGKVRFTAGTPPCPLGDLGLCPPTLAPGLMIVTPRLQGNAQQRILHNFEHDPHNAKAVGDEIEQIDDPGRREPGPFPADRRDKQFCLRQRQAADPIDLLGDHHLGRAEGPRPIRNSLGRSDRASDAFSR